MRHMITIIGGLNLNVVVFGICCSCALNGARTLLFSCHEESHPPLHALFGADKPKKEKFAVLFCTVQPSSFSFATPQYSTNTTVHVTL